METAEDTSEFKRLKEAALATVKQGNFQGLVNATYRANEHLLRGLRNCTLSPETVLGLSQELGNSIVLALVQKQVEHLAP